MTAPAPWRVAELDRRVVEGADGLVVADVRDWRDPKNAHLIAAAPTLYAALERLLELDGKCDFRDDTYPDPATCPGIAEDGIRCHWCEGWAALATARGEEQP